MDKKSLVENCIIKLNIKSCNLDDIKNKILNKIENIDDYNAIAICVETQKYLKACEEFISRVEETIR